MNAATLAARAPGDWASVGMIISLSSSSSANSSAVKNLAAAALLAPRQIR